MTLTHDYIHERWRAMVPPPTGESHSILTNHLPTEVVEQEIVFYLQSITDPENPRKGATSHGFRLGDHENTCRSADEAEYLVAVVLEAMTLTWQKFGDDRTIHRNQRDR